MQVAPEAVSEIEGNVLGAKLFFVDLGTVGVVEYQGGDKPRQHAPKNQNQRQPVDNMPFFDVFALQYSAPEASR
jgi:hypothetical protein